ncbi:hypothetical protein [Oceanobacillus bengalensis]|uniref:Uncharacterized protein n=1 Tax=Oceanobacillus bengalensis TaxID=1435466 RepID=A0A494Z5J3_9BACI|nr:hypothetical protein [Oceanobacillus bengalensis]RKQ17586.1 hypothetical protein D8M05_04090 [Oceanobacillus bengalensis]
MSEEQEINIKSLISISPKLYQKITKELENKYHIHSYDLQVTGIKQEEGIKVVLRFGEHFNNEKEQFFSYESLEDDKALDTFIDEAGETCKQVLIDDYFKKMAP